MTDTDMVAWINTGRRTHEQQDLYSTGQNNPNVLSQNAYSTSLTDSNNTYAVFTSYRPLVPTQGDTYTIPLDEPIYICWAYYATNSLSVKNHHG